MSKQMGFFIVLFSLAASASESIGYVEYLEGAATLTRGTATPIVEETEIQEGDLITTSEGGHVKILLLGENELDINSNSKVKIQKYMLSEDKKQSLIGLLYGTLRTLVQTHYDGENKFEVETPAAVVGVRGTDFLITHDQKSEESEVTSFNGTVRAGTRTPNDKDIKFVNIEPGQSSHGDKSARMSAPEAVEPTKLERLKQQTQKQPKSELKNKLGGRLRSHQKKNSNSLQKNKQQRNFRHKFYHPGGGGEHK